MISVWRLRALVGLLATATVLGLAIWMSPDGRGFGTHEQLGLAPCAYLQRTGQPCLSCGMTTAYSNTVRGRFVSATEANPMGMVLCLLTLGALLWCARCLVKDRDPVAFLFVTRWGRWLPAALAVLVIGTWWLRHG